MKDQSTQTRSRAGRRWVGLGIFLALLLIANWALAQTTIHKNGFESKVGWTKGGAEAVFEEIAHKIDDRDPHSGQTSEYIELSVKSGQYIHYVYPVSRAPVSDELRAALWLRAN